MYVASGAQRRGIGTALLRALIRACTDQGFRQMVATIGDSGHAASIRLHRTAGFEMVGTLRNIGFKHGRCPNAVPMTRALGGRANTLENAAARRQSAAPMSSPSATPALPSP